MLSDETYGGDYYKSHKNEVAFVTSVLKRTGLDFGRFDKNGDGIIAADELVVYLLFAGYEKSASIKPHPSGCTHGNRGTARGPNISSTPRTILSWGIGLTAESFRS
ncbi:MAG: hypothetical protein ACLUEQ_00500 [Cloacibacillus evryensis]